MINFYQNKFMDVFTNLKKDILLNHLFFLYKK